MASTNVPSASFAREGLLAVTGTESTWEESMNRIHGNELPEAESDNDIHGLEEACREINDAQQNLIRVLEEKLPEEVKRLAAAEPEEKMPLQRVVGFHPRPDQPTIAYHQVQDVFSCVITKPDRCPYMVLNTNKDEVLAPHRDAIKAAVHDEVIPGLKVQDLVGPSCPAIFADEPLRVFLIEDFDWCVFRNAFA
jgi:hypothetical protein